MNTLNHEIARTNGLLPTLNRGFGGVISALGTMSPAAGNAARSVSTVATGLRAAGVAAGAAVGIVGGVALGFTALSVAALAAGAAMAGPVDAMNLLIGKLNASSGSMESAKVLYADTVAIANRLGVAVGDVGSAMARFAGVGKDIGLANSDVSSLTETFLKLGKVSGQTA